jgi:phosphatidylinositol kinase/protein kinase (PI-3  family)
MVGAKEVLSVEGQVNTLIAEATDMERLQQMYFGWGAFI